MAAKPAIGGGEKWNLASFARQIAGIGQEIGCVLLKRSRPGVTPGFWNGALPPIGYRIVAGERRGAKVKKTLYWSAQIYRVMSFARERPSFAKAFAISDAVLRRGPKYCRTTSVSEIA